jgi:hypothetical protein
MISKLELDDAVQKVIIDGRRHRTNFGLYKGSSLADFAVLDAELMLIETKSDADTVKRLPEQERHYSQIGDRCVLVTGPRLFEKASKLVPDWWGLEVAREEAGFVFLEERRAAKRNPNINPVWLAKLLWKNELQEILRATPAGMRRLSGACSHDLAVELTKRVTLDGLRERVRHALMHRVGDAKFIRSGGLA